MVLVGRLKRRFIGLETVSLMAAFVREVIRARDSRITLQILQDHYVTTRVSSPYNQPSFVGIRNFFFVLFLYSKNMNNNYGLFWSITRW